MVTKEHLLSTTVEQLRTTLLELFPDSFTGTDEELIWYVSVFNAAVIFDCYTIKDLAIVLVDGIPKMTLDGIQSFIDDYYDDEEGGSISEFLSYVATRMVGNGEEVELEIKALTEE